MISTSLLINSTYGKIDIDSPLNPTSAARPRGPNEITAWRIVFAYARRWRVEMALRFEKTELGFEAPRLHTGDLVDLHAGPGLHQFVHRAAERARVAQQRGDVAEHDPRLGIIGNGADRGFQVVFERRRCHGVILVGMRPGIVTIRSSVRQA